MSKQDRNTGFTIAIVLIVCTLSLIVVGASLWRIIEPGFNTAMQFFGFQVQLATVDYNFDVPPRQDTVVNPPAPEPLPQPAPNPTPQPQPQPELVDTPTPTLDEYVYVLPQPPLIVPANYSYNFPVPTLAAANESISNGFRDSILGDAQLAGYGQGGDVPQSNLTILIDKIGVKSPVLQGLGGDNLLDLGFWVYPGSYPIGEGEMVLLCHRRFFGPYDPRTCWNIDYMAIGDEITIRNPGSEAKYRVVSTSIVDDQDAAIYNISDTQNYLKIVTCHPLYSNEQRFVVLAELIS